MLIINTGSMNKFITLNHGSGGRASQDLIRNVFIKAFGNMDSILTDSAVLKNAPKDKLALTTDSFVVEPLFFPGGDIGKLAVCGTVNDIVVSGAVPKYITASFILEEGYPIKDLQDIVKSMAWQAKQANVSIVAGDTKVVQKGKCDGVFINTAGIGFFENGNSGISTGGSIKVGDKIIINGFIGDHSIAILGARNELEFETNVKSDCACLNELIQDILKEGIQIKFMRDVTRGGLATVLNELVEIIQKGVEIEENEVPVRDSVKGLCEILGFDPLYLANEGKVLMLVSSEEANKAIEILKKNSLGINSSIIGEVVEDQKPKVVGKTKIGGKRIINMLQGEQLPRIC